MKRLLFIIAAVAALLTISMISSAQDTESTATWTPGELQKKGTHLAIGGEKLPKAIQTLILSDVEGEDLNPQWNKYSNEAKAGLWTLVGGSVVFTGGITYMTVLGVGYVLGVAIGAGVGAVATGGQGDMSGIGDSVAEGMRGKFIASEIITVAGLAGMTTGIVLLCVGHSNLRKIVNYCNSIGSPETAYFDFGTTASGGIGLTFNF